MYEVVVLSLAAAGESCQPRVPVRGCLDALNAAGAKAEAVTAGSDSEIDDVLSRLPAPGDTAGSDDPAPGVRLVVAAAVDAQLRAVLRRMVRRWVPAGSQRPDDLPADRTVPDLPPVAVLPLDPAGGGLVAALGLPREPEAVASAVLGDRLRRLDLLRQDGSPAVTLDGALLGSSDENGRAVPWRARVEVDDAVLATGEEPLLAGVVANASGYTQPDGLPLVIAADPADGRLDVAVALPVRRRWSRRVRVEVRRAKGRAVTIRPVDGPGTAAAGLACLDDGIAGTLTRQRSWWVERGAWGVYTGG